MGLLRIGALSQKLRAIELRLRGADALLTLPNTPSGAPHISLAHGIADVAVAVARSDGPCVEDDPLAQCLNDAIAKARPAPPAPLAVGDALTRVTAERIDHVGLTFSHSCAPIGWLDALAGAATVLTAPDNPDWRFISPEDVGGVDPVRLEIALGGEDDCVVQVDLRVRQSLAELRDLFPPNERHAASGLEGVAVSVFVAVPWPNARLRLDLRPHTAPPLGLWLRGG